VPHVDWPVPARRVVPDDLLSVVTRRHAPAAALRSDRGRAPLHL